MTNNGTQQFEGLFPMPVWFEVGVPQSFAWTLLAPYIKSCPAGNPRLPWQNFPTLHILNNYNAIQANGSANASYPPAITHNRQLSHPGDEVHFFFEPPGQAVGPNMSYVTSTITEESPKWAAWFNQLNITYTPLYNVSENEAYTRQPNLTLYSELNQIVNGTVFVALTDTDLYLTPHNVSLVLPHVVAGPNLWQAG